MQPSGRLRNHYYRCVSELDEGFSAVDLFIRFDRLAAFASLAYVVGANIFFVREAPFWALAGVLGVLNLALWRAATELNAGRLHRALAYVAGGNWFIAIIIPLLLPFLWPIMSLTVMMPLVLSTPYLSRRQIMPTIVSAAAVSALVAAIGLLNDDGGVIRDVDDAVELVLVIGALSLQIVPIGFVVWQQNQMQRQNLDSLQELNAELLNSELALASSRDRVVQAADTERRRIERDLHDGAQQRLVAMGVRMRLLHSEGVDDPVVQQGLEALLADLDGAIEEVRELAHGIYPPLLQTRGLPDAIAAVARRSPLSLRTEVEPVGRAPEAVETALYFVALEALTNAAKHAPDSTVTLTLKRSDDVLTLRVTDDGPGFDAANAPRSRGFDNMRDRLAVVGGQLEVTSELGTGTTLVASVPASQTTALPQADRHD